MPQEEPVPVRPKNDEREAKEKRDGADVPSGQPDETNAFRTKIDEAQKKLDAMGADQLQEVRKRAGSRQSPEDANDISRWTDEEVLTHFRPMAVSRNADKAYVCFNAAARIMDCQGGVGLMAALAEQFPELAFERYFSFRSSPHAFRLLETAAYGLADRGKADALIGRFPPGVLSPERRDRLLTMAERKQKNAKWAKVLITESMSNTSSADMPASVDALLADPALRDVDDVKEEWIDWSKLPLPPKAAGQEARWKIQVRCIVARNLFFAGQQADERTVREQVLRLVATREKYKGIAIFAGRNVVHAVHVERIRDTRGENGKPYENAYYASWESEAGSVYRYGKEATQEAIRLQQQGNGSYEFLRPENTAEGLAQAKSRFLDRIRTSAPPSTFLFEGHGGPDALYFSEGTLANGVVADSGAIKVTLQEMIDAFRERAGKFPQLGSGDDPAKKDILLLSSCYNADFIRGLYTGLGSDPKPIALGKSEYGQVGWSRLNAKHSGDFLSDVLQLKRSVPVRVDAMQPSRAAVMVRGVPAKPTTFGDVFDYEFDSKSNPSLYIPDGTGTMQLTRDDAAGPDRT